MATTSKDLALTLRVKDAGATQTVKSFNSALTSVTKGITAITAGLTAIASVSFFRSSFNEARKLEEQMKTVSALTGLVGDNFAYLDKQTRSIAKGLGSLTALDLAKIEGVAAQLGIGAQKIDVGKYKEAADEIITFSKAIGFGAIALPSFKRDTEALSLSL